MISVASLLNPALEEAHPFPSPQTSTRDTPEFSSPSSPPPTKKQKMAKDAAIFTKSGPRGEVRYKPFEKYDSKTMAELEKFSIMPLGRIGEYHRHIPYNSDKRGFLEKTGREAFEGMYRTSRSHHESTDHMSSFPVYFPIAW